MKKTQLKKLIKEEISKTLKEDRVEVASMNLIRYPGREEYPLWIHELPAEDDDSGYIQISTSGAKIWVNKEKWNEFKALINRIQ